MSVPFATYAIVLAVVIAFALAVSGAVAILCCIAPAVLRRRLDDMEAPVEETPEDALDRWTREYGR